MKALLELSPRRFVVVEVSGDGWRVCQGRKVRNCGTAKIVFGPTTFANAIEELSKLCEIPTEKDGAA